MQTNSKYFFYTWFAVLLLVAGYLRVHGSDTYHFHVDELMHMKIAEGKDLRQVLQYSLFETHPPLGHFIRYFWNKLSQASWYARSLSLVFGMATIPLYYAIGKKLNGELAGMAAAALIAFSHGCILQSYVVRNYSMFVFFLSAALYYYLLWQENRTRTRYLLYYFLWAAAACLTHFSGIFSIFLITVFEVVRTYLEKKDCRYLAKWLGINALIALVSIGAFLYWRTTLGPVEDYASHAASFYTLQEILLLPPLYLFNIVSYVFVQFAFIYAIAFMVPLAIAIKNPRLNHWLLLAAGALLFGVLLFLAKIYPFVGDRHNLWLLPFFIIPVAWMLADGLSSRIKNPALAAAVIFILCVAFYKPEERFSEAMEYKITEKQWSGISAYLSSLDNRTLLVSGKTDAIMMAPSETNIYAYIHDPAVEASSTSALIPYYHTHLLFDKTYRVYTQIMLGIAEHAFSSGMLRNYDKIVIMSSFVPSDFTGGLALCSVLNKKIVAFPALPPGYVLNVNDLRKYSVEFIEIKKQDFIDQVINPHGQARNCVQDGILRSLAK